MLKFKYIAFVTLIMSILSATTGCKKFIEIDPPKSSITTGQLFSDNTQAEWAVAGIYSKMIMGIDQSLLPRAAEMTFSAGLATILGSFSADEMHNSDATFSPDYYYLHINRLTTDRAGAPANAWKTAYKVVYDANAVIEGLAASTSLLDSVKDQLRGEALALRSFAYFYLVNFFGDVPLALTIDYTKTINLSRAPVAKVYEQIINDLIEARSLVADDFSVGKDERVRVNSWFVEALLARIYLYTGKYQDAITSATNVINKTDYFSLEPNLADVFSSTSREAILQLKPTNTDGAVKNAMPEGYLFSPLNAANVSVFQLNEYFVQSFDTDDQRKNIWITQAGGMSSPFKYTVGALNGTQFGPQPQYYMVIRLAELYLIRAEASLLLSESNKDAAINDLNALRERTGLDALSPTLNAAEVTEAIANERKFELFAEWGHRWLDLKRTGKAIEVLSQIPSKQPWAGDHQLLYPIPASEIRNNKNITQNPGYDVQ